MRLPPAKLGANRSASKSDHNDDSPQPTRRKISHPGFRTYAATGSPLQAGTPNGKLTDTLPLSLVMRTRRGGLSRTSCFCFSASHGARGEHVRRLKLTGILLGAQLLTTVWAGAQGHRIELVPRPVSSAVPKNVFALLDSQGTRLLDARGEVECEVWWIKTIPTQKSVSTRDVFYSNLAVGTLLGVMHFPRTGHDFRGQAIRPGYYTMRYALMPQDESHAGVSSYRDFVLLGSVTVDNGAQQTLPFHDLLQHSRQVTEAGHPAAISLVQVNTAFKTFPVLSQDDLNLCILQIKLYGRPAGAGPQEEFSLAIVLLGATAANGVTS